MLNRIYIELYESYEKNGNIDEVIEFANKTFSDEEVRKFFIACMNLMFKTEIGFKPKYQMTKDSLCEYLLLAKEKCGNKTLLHFYLDRVNKTSDVVQYFKGIKDFERCADELLDYNKYYSLSMTERIKKDYSDKVEEYIKQNM